MGDRDAGLCRGSLSRVPAEHRAAGAVQLPLPLQGRGRGVGVADLRALHAPPTPLPEGRGSRMCASTTAWSRAARSRMFYDPMIAKLITWAPTREEAADLQVDGARPVRDRGAGHNIDFLSALMQHPRFRAGALTTGFIAEEYPGGVPGRAGRRGAAARDRRDRRGDATARCRRARRGSSGQLNGPPPVPQRMGRADRRHATSRSRCGDGHCHGRRRGGSRARATGCRGCALRPPTGNGRTLGLIVRRDRARLAADHARRDAPGARAAAAARRARRSTCSRRCRPTCRACC